MNGKWKKAKVKVEAVQAFDCLDRGGSQKPAAGYDTSGRLPRPSEGPPPEAQHQISPHGQSTSYYIGHPQSSAPTPYVGNPTQTPGPFQYTYQSPPPQTLQYTPQSSPPQQTSSPVADYKHTPYHSTYGPHHNSTTSSGYNAGVQSSSPRRDNCNGLIQPSWEQNRQFDTSDVGSPVKWNGADTPYDAYNQPRTDHSQRSNTAYGGDYQQHCDPRPMLPYGSSIVPNKYYHNCSDHLSQ
ncbi:uncharacterized protein CC84DRAFT_1240028 [Paraphaeosphaeria sporulosa]|uniref:Uncharacterized protein n=1 Tax=Paraphaeosphaeria sporulosa TaxID=1460663 RepID=A0A177CMA4_9PLEO|nr:uncharacterized protein CC84DRAFT_1240028 [Paraphaeosphaeria sporulosa]OAG08665.1 hypothetical protein CC84DRAFT_1240028 [Paraphaeosphaeria sporulosa]